jgi:hypothetical protein
MRPVKRYELYRLAVKYKGFMNQGVILGAVGFQGFFFAEKAFFSELETARLYSGVFARTGAGFGPAHRFQGRK